MIELSVHLFMLLLLLLLLLLLAFEAAVRSHDITREASSRRQLSALRKSILVAQ